jgi:hypothetical protein
LAKSREPLDIASNYEELVSLIAGVLRNAVNGKAAKWAIIQSKFLRNKIFDLSRIIWRKAQKKVFIESEGVQLIVDISGAYSVCRAKMDDFFDQVLSDTMDKKVMEAQIRAFKEKTGIPFVFKRIDVNGSMVEIVVHYCGQEKSYTKDYGCTLCHLEDLAEVFASAN